MPFDIIRSDITTLEVDAIVNTTNSNLDIGQGVDQAIHNAAGPSLIAELLNHRYLGVTSTIITQGYNLKARKIIHTVGPVWEGGFNNEEDLLAQCYRNILLCAIENQIDHIAIPLISTGFHRFPKDRAIKIAMATIQKFLLTSDLHVSLVVYDSTSYLLSQKLEMFVKNYITRHIKETDRSFRLSNRRKEIASDDDFAVMNSFESRPMRSLSINDMLNLQDETFSQRLLRYIDERELADSAVYHRANVDRRLFSKIRSNVNYQPSKPTVIAFAIALNLNLDDTKDLLRSAGYALSSSQKFDLIIEYFIKEEKYDIMEINTALFHFDQPLLGN